MSDLFKAVASSIGVTLIVAASSVSASTFAQSQPGPTQCFDCDETSTEYPSCESASPAEQRAEQKVRDQVLKGSRTKLDEGSVIRGCFVRDLLIKGLGVPEIGIVIDGATIKGPIDIRNQAVNVRVELINCKFQDDFNMKRSQFSKGLSLARSIFGSLDAKPPNGRLDAEFAKFGIDLILDDTRFFSCPPFFKSISVGVDLSVRRAKFVGHVDFTGALIGNNFLAGKEDPGDPQTEFVAGADFEGARVGLDADFKDITFGCTTMFGNAEFNILAIDRSTFGDVNFKSTKIRDFYSGDHPADRFKGNLIIEDLTFQYMSPEDLEQLVSFAEISNTSKDQIKYNAQFYATLETILRKHGHDDWGDAVFIAGKRKERQYQSNHWYCKVWSYFLDGFIGYGRHVGRLLWWSLIFIALGCGMFWCKSWMERKEPQKTAEYTKRYNPFLYSLDLFLPIIGLGYADNWTPTTLWGRIYKPFHVIVGHLFVPIGLAAWTGLIK